jgi:hypothetical protein
MMRHAASLCHSWSRCSSGSKTLLGKAVGTMVQCFSRPDYERESTAGVTPALLSWYFIIPVTAISTFLIGQKQPITPPLGGLRPPSLPAGQEALMLRAGQGAAACALCCAGSTAASFLWGAPAAAAAAADAGLSAAGRRPRRLPATDADGAGRVPTPHGRRLRRPGAGALQRRRARAHGRLRGARPQQAAATWHAGRVQRRAGARACSGSRQS